MPIVPIFLCFPAPHYWIPLLFLLCLTRGVHESRMMIVMLPDFMYLRNCISPLGS
ncbi:hypothetical protein BJX65DRAFT_268264 [Aspergillus insuetus]